MRRRVATCCLIALLAPLPLSGRQSRTGWFDLPVQGGAATLATFGIPVEERALTLSLLARALHDRETRFSKSPRLVTDLVNATTTPTVGADTGRESIDIPAPLDAETWRQLLDLPGDADLFARFLTDRHALLLAAALAATDDSVRQHVARDRDLLRFLYREGAAAFHLVARSLAVADGRVVAPGGDEAPAIWELLAGVPMARVSPFVRALTSRDQGRLAWYFDAIAQMDERRQAAAWPRGPGRAAAARAFYDVFRDSDPPWRASEQPFRRSIGDAWTIATLTDVADGQPIGPMSAAFWRLVFESNDVDLEDAARQLSHETARLSLPAITREIVMQPPRDRRQRFEMFRLAQRVFPDPDGGAMPAVAVAINGYRRYPALLLALERMAIATPDTWAMLVAATRHVTDDAEANEASLASFQGAVAIVERLAHRRALDAAAAERLLLDLAAAVRADRKVTASIVRWMTETLLPALPPLERPDALSGRTAYESRLLQALAGPRATTGETRSLDWEGLRYVVDLTAAEHARLQAVRRLLPSPGLDAALTSKNPRDLAAALTAIAYAVALGHPDGAVALSRDVATRHDFGFNATALLQRITPWAPPEERQGDGPWHVMGALIGLDLGLSRLALRRVADEHMPQAPVLTLNDFATLTRTIVALVPTTLHEADRDALAASIARGRERVLDAQHRPDVLLALARQVRMSAVTRQVLPWMVSHDPQAILGAFSLRDLLWLGEPALTPAALDRWGVAGQAFDGRQVTLMPPPTPWEDFAGRPDAGQMTTQVPDLTLRLAEETARLRLPASLIPALLAYAVDDFWHDTQARFADDWPRMTRQAAAMDGPRVEDYVAALVGDGVLRSQ